MIVHFQEVGRDKKTRDFQTESLSDVQLIRELKRKRVLMSRDIDFSWEKNGGQKADIYIGGWRKVGSLTVEGGIKLSLGEQS